MREYHRIQKHKKSVESEHSERETGLTLETKHMYILHAGCGVRCVPSRVQPAAPSELSGTSESRLEIIAATHV